MEKHSTEHFDIYYFKNSTAEKQIDQIADEKEKGYKEICQFLEKDTDIRIRMIFFEDDVSKQNATGHQGAGWAFGNTIVEIYNEEQKLDPYHETTHILMNPFGRPPALFNEGFAVYMSREPIPTRHIKAFDQIPVFKQVCIIPFTADSLQEFIQLSPTPLEVAESIDMLRFIEHGRKVKMVETSYSTHAVDTPEDLELVEGLLQKDPLARKYL